MTQGLPDIGGGALAVASEGLTRRFGHQVAVDQVSLRVPVGAVYGFLGPNGSGKTTTIRMLLGLISAHEGSIHLLGSAMPRSAALVLPSVGALIEGPAFHPYLTGADNLRRLDAADRTANPHSSSQRIAESLSRVGLSAAASKRYRQYSLGMKQRLGIAAALLQPRKLLILDEPTNGLDPQGTREVRHLIRSLAADGATILVSSHLLAEVEQVATHVGIMSAGRLISQGTLTEVLAGAEPRLLLFTNATGPAQHVLSKLGLSDVLADLGKGTVTANMCGHGVDEITRALVNADVPVLGISQTRPALEDLFVSLTGEGFDVAS
ncbi:MAG: ATP-binding cassette domain-containing protein [Actinomycetes bacterium]